MRTVMNHANNRRRRFNRLRGCLESAQDLDVFTNQNVLFTMALIPVQQRRMARASLSWVLWSISKECGLGILISLQH
uniref:Uncharacterized protein n=1 Tax=Triticum urartu TaxID=4572 RepID=A0A8R7PNT3_TRIUA